MTEYRILPLRTFIADVYLQFKSLEVKKTWWGKTTTREVWRFIPRENVGYVLGEYLREQDCPTSLPTWEESRFLHSFHQQENYSLVPFTQQYPDLAAYFQHLNQKRAEYLLKEQEKKKLKTIYL